MKSAKNTGFTVRLNISTLITIHDLQPSVTVILKLSTVNIYLIA